MMFKVGDKVRIVKWVDSSMVDEICEVTEPHQSGSVFVCRVTAVNIKSLQNCSVYASEIKKMPIKGQQLLLFEL